MQVQKNLIQLLEDESGNSNLSGSLESSFLVEKDGLYPYCYFSSICGW